MFSLGDIVTMKKPHACGANRWEVIRMGADFKIKCLSCTRIVLLPRKEFERKVKNVKVRVKDVLDTEENYIKFEN